MSTTTTPDVQRLVALIRRQITRPDIMHQLWLLLAEHGEPISTEALAAAGGWSRQDVREEFARQPGTDWDERGRIAGFGLTLHRTPHPSPSMTAPTVAPSTGSAPATPSTSRPCSAGRA